MRRHANRGASRALPFRPTALIAAVATWVMWTAGCGDGPTYPPPDPPSPTTLTVTPANAELTALGATVQLTAQVSDQYGQAMSGASVTWTSGDAQVATVDGSGLVESTGNGAVTITATAGSASGTAAVTVAQVVAEVAVSPAADTLVAFGDTVRLAAQAADANGHAVAGAEFTWASSDTLVARVDDTGLVESTGNGAVTITATAGSASGTAAVTVAQVVAEVAVSPAADTLVAFGDTVRLAAQAADAHGHAVAGAEFTWASSDTLVAAVDGSGLVESTGNGAVTITAMAGSASGTAAVTVAQVVAEVAVSPAADTLVAFGDTVRLAAEAADAHGHAVTGAEFTWSSSDTLVARVDDTGLVESLAAGGSVVTATASDVTGRAELRVVPALPLTLRIRPDSVRFAALGKSEQLSAEVRDQAGRLMVEALVSWSSGDTLVAAVDSAGLLTALGGGTAAVTAEAGEASDTVLVTVMQVTDSVVVSPARGQVPLGDTLRLVAEAFDGNGHVVAAAGFVWSSGEAAVATVDESGLVTGVTEGTVTITAAGGGAEGSAQIRVENPDRAALVAFYNATDGPNWVDNTNWLSDATLGEWYGVSTDGEGRVRSVQLVGQWDSDARGYVPHGLTGPIPPELGNLSKLEWLNLGGNDLTGPIPPEFGNLSNLEWLILFKNNLTGPIPPELGNLSNLVQLYLAGNDLTGPIPPELGNLSNLVQLYLGGNDLTGPIPPELGGLSNLESLSLQPNLLTGPIPPELGGLSNLVRLYLGGNDLTGPIPPELGTLSNLESLGLAGNDLTGPIPPELGGLSNLDGLYLHNNHLTGPIPPELGNLSNVGSLWLLKNDLTGPIPPELGNLSNVSWLTVGENRLTGVLPRSFLNLTSLEVLGWGCGRRGVCVPGTSEFVAWLTERSDVSRQVGPFCNAADQAVVTGFYEAAGGDGWTESGGWLDGPALEEWHGVSTDSLGRVTALHLSDNGLSGAVSAGIGALGQLRSLRVDGNEHFGGRLPPSLSNLDLDEFHYDGTDLCEPDDAAFRDWLDGIPSHRGTGVRCSAQTDRDVLTALYQVTGGRSWDNNRNWLSEAPLDAWHGVEVDDSGRVTSLDLGFNDLTGPIPPELGGLSNLEYLDLRFNDLTGPIPPELGDLSNLEWLWLAGNDLTGPIPPELGGLSNLVRLVLGWNALTGPIPAELGGLSNLGGLALFDNALTGPIPPELGGLSNLWELWLSSNDLSGPIPPELGRLSNLEVLYLQDNDLSGPIPPEFGGLASLRELELARNEALGGALPESLTGVRLESLQTGGTELCAPQSLHEWLATIPRRWIPLCGEGTAAYLVQAVQSRTHPVPLVAGEDALLRVFVTAAMETTEGIPEVRARFYLNGTERHVADIPASSTPIPTEIDEGDLSKSANAEIPAGIVQPGLEVVIEIDPGGTLDASLGVPTRIPEEGRMAVEVREMPTLDLTVIPFLWSSDPDSAIIGQTRGMEADPEGHALLEETHVLLPVDDIDVTARSPVVSTSNNAFDLLSQTEAVRVLEGGSGHYMGMMSGAVTRAAGVAYLGGRSSFSVPGSGVIAHELGHNMSLLHAPCGVAGSLDPSFPYRRGNIGAWGYDFRRARMVPTTRKDHMSYCGPTWTSDYHFANALAHRLADEGSSATALATAPVTSLLLWGGVDTTGVPFLNPVFVANAPPALPDSAGDWTVTGHDAGGRELFSLSFTMPVAQAEEDDVSSFVFALPVRPGWADALAGVTLSGPDGTATLDADSDKPMAILRDPVTGQVRGFLEDPATVAAVAAGTAPPGAAGLDVLFSRGIPDAAAWRR